jgi:hypothetical protein
VLGDISRIERNQHIAGTNPVSRLHADGGNRRNDSTGDRCGFLCGDHAARLEPLRCLDGHGSGQRDRNRVVRLRPMGVVAPAACGRTTRRKTHRDDAD